MKAAIVLSALLSCNAYADSFVTHLYTKHPREQPWMQNKTPGIGYQFDEGYQIGVYCNSYSASKLKPENNINRNCNTSYYAAYVYNWEYANLIIGGVKGYNRGIHIPGFNADIQPLISPGIKLGPIHINVLAPKTYHLSIESKL
jgi:hypothetical protein